MPAAQRIYARADGVHPAGNAVDGIHIIPRVANAISMIGVTATTARNTLVKARLLKILKCSGFVFFGFSNQSNGAS